MNKFLFYMNNIGLLFSCLFILNSIVEGDNYLSAFFLLLVLSLFQLVMSITLLFKKDRSNFYLDLHFTIGLLYILLLLGLEPVDIKKNVLLLFGLIPLKIAILFTYGVWKQLHKEEGDLKKIRDHRKATFVLESNQ